MRFSAAKLLMISAPSDMHDLASTLVKQRIAFQFAMVSVEVGLVMQSFGLGTVDVRRLVDAVEGMREQFRYLSQGAAVSAL